MSDDHWSWVTAWPKVQVALDLVRTRDAVKIARAAWSAGIDWLEAGTPLIKSEGMEVVRVLSQTFPRGTVVADMKTLDAGEIEVEMALKAGAQVVSISGLSHDRTIKDAVTAKRRHGGRLMVDLLMSSSPVRRARELEKLGADIVCVHTGVDAQKEHGSGPVVSPMIRRLTRVLRVPVAVAGGINPDSVEGLIRADVKLLIVGGWITGSRDPARASREIMKSVSATLGPSFRRGGSARQSR